MKDPIERADALAATALGDTVNQLQAKIRAIPRAPAGALEVPTEAILQALADHNDLLRSAAAIAKMPAAPYALHRSFPEAGDGRPMPPMGDELMTAGLDAEDARFVAVQLAQNGWMLTPSPVDASQTADPAINALDDLARLGQEYDAAPDPAAIREAALREAAELIRPILSRSGNGVAVAALHRNADRILALIPKGATE